MAPGAARAPATTAASSSTQAQSQITSRQEEDATNVVVISPMATTELDPMLTETYFPIVVATQPQVEPDVSEVVSESPFDLSGVGPPSPEPDPPVVQAMSPQSWSDLSAVRATSPQPIVRAMSPETRSALETSAMLQLHALRPHSEAANRLYDDSKLCGVVAVSLRKELLHEWATCDPSSLDVGLVDIIVANVVLNTTETLLEAVNHSVVTNSPKTDAAQPRVESSMLVPIGPAMPSSPHDALELAELVEEFQGVLGHTDLLEGLRGKEDLFGDVSRRLPATHPWQSWMGGGGPLLLSNHSALSVAAVVAPVVLSVRSGLRPPSTTPLLNDLEDGQSPLYNTNSLPVGAPQGLARALRCRRRVFNLERELATRNQAEQERQAFERRERDMSEARLMEVNHVLAEKLKARIYELRKTQQQLKEEQRSLHEAKLQLVDRRKEIDKLNHQLAQDTSIRKEHIVREKQHCRSLLRAAAREREDLETTKTRIAFLRKCLEPSALALADRLEQDLASSQLGMTQVPATAEESLSFDDKLEERFFSKMAKRRAQYDESFEQFQKTMSEKREEYNKLTELVAACR